MKLNLSIIKTIAIRTLRQYLESPIAYLAAIFYYGFIGVVFSLNFFDIGNASIKGIALSSPWVLWFVIPILTMGLFSEELRTGTFENLSTLPIRDWEIVLGKYLGFVILAALLIVGLLFFPILVSFLTDHPYGMDWGENIGSLGGLFFLCLLYGAMGLWTSSLSKNQVVAVILGMIFCTFFFFVGQFLSQMSGFISRLSDFLGVVSHMQTIGRGVWDIRDLFYFISFIFIFLYLTAMRLSTRRF